MAIVKEGQVQGIPLAYSPDAAAVMLALPRTKIYELLKTGQLRYAKVGKRTLISQKALEAYAAEIFGEEGEK